MKSLKKHYDYIVIGGGPAGIQLGYFFEKHGMDYIIFEKADSIGDFFNKYPRHGKLISINKVHTGYSDKEVNMRWDWNSLLSEEEKPILFKDYSKEYFPNASSMVDYISDFAVKNNINVRVNSDIQNVITEENGQFRMELNGDTDITCKVLVVATGLSHPWIPEIPGIEHVKNYCNMSINGEEYENKRILILGKGNSAFETADALVPHAAMIHMSSPNSLKMAWTTHYVGHLRAINNNFLDTYQLKSQNALLDSEIQRIEKSNDGFNVIFAYNHAEGENETIYYDEVIVCTGFQFDSSIFGEQCKPQVCDKGKFPVQSSMWESSNIDNLFFAGTLMQYRDHKKYMSGFVHGFRYNVKTLFNILRDKYESVALPETTLNLNSREMTKMIIERVNKTSSLWQQPGFLCDFILLRKADKKALVKSDLYVDYCLDNLANNEDDFLILTLEFGKTKLENPFNVSRIARYNSNKAEDSNFLHPILRHYKGNKLISTHHVIEDLAAEWLEPEHIEPLKEYLEHNINDLLAEATESVEKLSTIS